MFMCSTYSESHQSSYRSLMESSRSILLSIAIPVIQLLIFGVVTLTFEFPIQYFSIVFFQSAVATLLQDEYYPFISFWPSLFMNFSISLAGSSSVLFIFHYHHCFSQELVLEVWGARFSRSKNE